MKISIIVFGSMSYPSINASWLRFVSLSKIWHSFGYKVFLVGLSDQIIEKSFDEFTFISMPKPKTIKHWFKRFYDSTYISNIINNVDGKKLVIFNNYMSIPTLKILNNFKNNSNIKICLSLDEWYKESYLSIKGFVKNIDTNFRINILPKKIHNFICVSSRFHEVVKRKNPNSNSVVIPSIVSNIKSTTTYISRSKIIEITFCGKISTKKSKEWLKPVIKSIQKINSEFGNVFSLNIIGINGGNLSNIKFYGLITHEKCLDIIRKSSFTIIPRKKSRKNDFGFPTKLSESLSCGTPVIATDTSDIKTYIKDGVNGYIVNSCNEKSFYNLFLNIYKKSLNDETFIEKLKYNCIKFNTIDNELFFEKIKIFMENLK